MKRRAGKFKILTCYSLIIFIIVPLSGCWDANDAERLVYAQGLGVDHKHGKYTVYVQLINLSLLAKSSSSSGQQIYAEIGKASGTSIEDAVFNLYKTSQRRIHWGHLTYILFSTSAINHNGLQGVTDLLDRYFETHYHMWLYSTDKQLSNVMNSMPPINMSTYSSRISDPDAEFGQYSFIESLDMREIFIRYYEPPHEIILPYIISSKKDWKDDNTPRNIGIIKGISIMGNDKVKGKILGNDANGYRWIEKKFKRTGISFQSKHNANISLIIYKRKVKIIPIIKQGTVQFDLQLKVKSEISRLETAESTLKIRSEAKKLIQKEILHTYQKGLEIDSDVYQLSRILYEENYPVWKKLQINGKLSLTKDSIRNVNIKLIIQNAGKQRKIPTLK